jgi:hypothetical protein
MEKLIEVLSGNMLDFAATFGAATRELDSEAPSPGCPVWLEGWVAPARVGYVLGDGEFIYKGQTRRFIFTGLPLRLGHGARVSGIGTVSGLRQLRDFGGFYLPWCDAPSGGTGGCAVCLKNANGVVIALTASEEGELLELPYGGLRVRLTTDL